MSIFNDIMHVFSDFDKYLVDAYQKVSPIFTFAFVGINYALFPDKAYIPAALALGGAMLMDIITKYYSLQKPYGGVFNAIKQGAIKSAKFWEGTKKKLISYLVIMILCGLSVRVAPVAFIAVLLSTTAYTIMFLREAQSCVENLIAAGHEDLSWFLFVIKRKQKTVLEKDGVVTSIEALSSFSDDGLGNTNHESCNSTVTTDSKNETTTIISDCHTTNVSNDSEGTI